MIGSYNPAVAKPLPTGRVIMLPDMLTIEVPGRVEPTPEGLRAYAAEERAAGRLDWALTLERAAQKMETLWSRGDGVPKAGATGG